jgi:2-keto-4-pentenoate hydratase/2-oxohepta-3-ene-1,7-dioic acid hydratase in catechol pathway
MRLASFLTSNHPEPQLGIVHDNEVLDVAIAGSALNLSVPASMLEFIAATETYLPRLQTIVEHIETLREHNAVLDLNSITLTAPIPQPRKNIMCMAVNYSEHARETAAVRNRGTAAPTQPILFTKSPTTINGPYGNVIIDPEVSIEIDWEVELGVIIGKPGKNITEENAMAHVFGYTVLNDVTARDLQKRHVQYFKGKSLDGSCPMGPWIVTADEIPDPHHLALRLKVNGVIKQDDNTAQMVFYIPQIIATLSLGMTLESGDIIATGTPSGVGFTRVPPEFLKPGDVMETEIEKIGVLRNPIIGK